MRLLLLSNSTNPGELYLEYPSKYIQEFLGTNAKNALFIPYAAVTFSFDDYHKLVAERFLEWGYKVESIHHFKNPASAVGQFDAIIVGGGNTFNLLKWMQENKLLEPIFERVGNQNLPYIGWSAGANMACPTIMTTNDMPIVQPENFKALDLVDFQINPHYTDYKPENHGGETRDQRIAEFTCANPNTYVVGLREGTIIRVENESLKLLGGKPAKIFIEGSKPKEYDELPGFLKST